MSMTIKVEELRGIAILDCIEIAHGTEGLGSGLDEIHLGISFDSTRPDYTGVEQKVGADLAVRRCRAESLATDLERMANRLRVTARAHAPKVVRMACRECQAEFAADDVIDGKCLTCNSRYLELV